MLQINLYPGVRYPSWDSFWVDVRTLGGLWALKDALSVGELPLFDPYTGLGFNIAGNHHSPIGLSNFLVAFFDPLEVMVFGQYAALLLSAFFAFRYLRIFSDNGAACFLGAVVYIGAPIVTSRYYFDQTLYGFLFLSIFLYHTHMAYTDRHRSGFLFHVFAIAGWAFVTIGMADIFFLMSLPITITSYGFVIARFQRGLPVIHSLISSVVLALVALAGGAYYLFPLAENLVMNSVAARPFIDAALMPGGTEYKPGNFAQMFLHGSAKSLIFPMHGAGSFLYVPMAFYLAMLFAAKRLWKDNSRCSGNLVAISGLVASVLAVTFFVWFFYSEIFHMLLPKLSGATTGSLRHLWNVIPFLMTLAAFIAIISFGSQERVWPRWLMKAAWLGMVWEYLLFFVLKGAIGDSLYKVTHENETGFDTSNLFSVTVFNNPWIVLPISNLLLILVLSILLVPNARIGNRKIAGLGRYVIVAAVALFSLSVHNEVRIFQGNWQLTTKNDFRWRTYVERRECIDRLVDRSDRNHRTLYASAEIFGPSGRNWKLIAETEMHVGPQERTLFSFREVEHPFTAMVSGAFSNTYMRMVTWVPTSRQILDNMELLDLLSVKWVIGANVELIHERLKKRGSCKTEKGPMDEFVALMEGGEMFVYEVINPVPLAWGARTITEMSGEQVIQSVFVDGDRPWVSRNLLVDHIPADWSASTAVSDGDLFNVSGQTFLSTSISVQAKTDRMVFVGFANRPNLTAYVDGNEVETVTAYAGMMAVPVKAGIHEIVIRYSSSWHKAGVLVAFSTLVVALLLYLYGRYGWKYRPVGTKPQPS